MVYAVLFLGALKLAQIVFKLLACTLCVLKGAFSSSNPRRFGNWAVVTGATDGIGFAYAKELARRGLNVVIIGRDPAKLADSAAKIKEKAPKVEVKTIQADFKQRPYEHIANELKDVPVGILVNNVGLSYGHPEFFHESAQATDEDLLAVNVAATTLMTKIVLPGMVQRKKGAVVNISSAAGSLKVGNPLLAVYGATKAYVDQFSRGLNTELAGKGVVVQSQVPYFVATKMSKIRTATHASPSPDTWAKAAVKAIGRKPSVVPHWFHRIQDAIVNAVPRFALKKFLLSQHHSLRRRAHKKAAAQKSQ